MTKYKPKSFRSVKLPNDRFVIIANGRGEVAEIIARPAEDAAALFEAAPDLLQALVNLVDAHDQQPSILTEAEWAAARAAIAKAKGE